MKKKEMQWKRAVENWQQRLNLQAWDIKWEVKTKLTDDDDTAAEITINTTYLNARIDVKSSWLKTASVEKINETACHELLHLVFASLDKPLQKYIEDLVETMVSHLTKVLAQ